MFLAGTQGLMDAAYRFKTHAAAPASPAAMQENETNANSSEEKAKLHQADFSGPRFLTYAHFYVRKAMLATFKDASNQVSPRE